MKKVLYRRPQLCVAMRWGHVIEIVEKTSRISMGARANPPAKETKTPNLRKIGAKSFRQKTSLTQFRDSPGCCTYSG
jgi:hypothetical protein